MIKIGDFAKIFDVSIKTIRFYEEKGLIVPSFIDVYSGYRYFDDHNIKEMSKILYLKEKGLSLEEIKNFNDDNIDYKIKEYEEKIKHLKQNISDFISLKETGGIDSMEAFYNDPRVIGKWKLVGVSNSKEDYYEGNLLDDSFSIKELYLMEKGKKYWVISWTLNYIIINGRKNPYEIENDLMFVKVYGVFDDSEYKYAIYKKEDDKKYSIQDFMIKDDIKLEYKEDNDLVGNWKAIDFVYKKDMFNKEKKASNYLAVDKLSVHNDFEVLISYNGGKLKKVKYTKGYITNLVLDDTLCKYEIRKIDDKNYLFVEWKSGDYVYAGQINGYYVFEKE